MKKAVSCLLGISILVAAFSTPVFAAGPADLGNEALYASSGVTFQGSPEIQGDVLVTGGTVSGRDYRAVTGTVYQTGGAAVTIPSLKVQNYEGEAKNFEMGVYQAAPEAGFFAGSDFSDGKQDITVGWSGNEKPDGFTLDHNAFLHKLKVGSGLTVNISAGSGEIRVVRVKNLTVNGSLNVTGGGRVILYVDNMSPGSNGFINASGTPDQLTIVLANDNKISTFTKIAAHIVAPASSVVLHNVTLTGNVYAGGNVTLQSSGEITGLVYAPNSDTRMLGSVKLSGQLVTRILDMNGNTRIVYGKTTGLPSDVEQELVNGGGSKPDETPGGETVTISVVVPRRMSVRMADGAVLKNGDTFTMPKYGTVQFQMCTNNWDTDTYTDGGQGIAGTKVYSYTHEKNKDNVMRVDTNTYFMAVRFHFVKGDYEKLTGIDQVLSTPLESLSVNLPLGSTIDANAYVKGKVVQTGHVFVQTGEDKTLSYTDYYWEY